MRFVRFVIGYFVGLPLFFLFSYLFLKGVITGLVGEFRIQYQDFGNSIIYLFFICVGSIFILWNFQKSERKIEEKESQQRQDWNDQAIKDQYKSN